VGLPVVIEVPSAMAAQASISASARARHTILFIESVTPFKLVGWIHYPSHYILSNERACVYTKMINSKYCLKIHAIRLFVNI
jgi:hypothetical protein